MRSAFACDPRTSARRSRGDADTDEFIVEPMTLDRDLSAGDELVRAIRDVERAVEELRQRRERLKAVLDASQRGEVQGLPRPQPPAQPT